MQPINPEPFEPTYPTHAEHRMIHRIGAVDTGDWIPAAAAAETGEVIGPETFDMKEARALVVKPDEILVIVVGHTLSNQEAEAHRAHITRVLGNRFLLLGGGDLQLAKIKSDDWGGPTHPQNLNQEPEEPR